MMIKRRRKRRKGRKGRNNRRKWTRRKTVE